ncbi:MAG: dUTP diphosphatase [Acidobacteriota bacterium]
MKVRVRSLSDLPLPERASVGASGFDLRAAVEETVVLSPGERLLVPAGISLEIPSGWEAQVRPRSGLAYKHGVTVANAPGTIDSDYRGEIKVILIHLGNEPFAIERGDRIAQLVFARVEAVEWDAVDSLTDSRRQSGGFGSTGRK